MMRQTMRWLSVVGALCGSWSAVAMAEGSPVDSGGVEGEGIREMKALYEAEQSLLQEKDKYSQDLAQVGFAPAACADGSRAPVPGPGWVAGCHFAYQVTSVVVDPLANSFTAIARGAVGTPAEGVTLGLGAPASQTVVLWLEQSGTRRFVDWDQPEPGESVCAAQERVGKEGLNALFTAERAYLQEKDRYSSNLDTVGFLPLTCTDGTRPSGPDSSWVGGCRFIYQVELTGPFSFIATARAVSGLVAGMTLRMDETGTLTRTPAPSGACP